MGVGGRGSRVVSLLRPAQAVPVPMWETSTALDLVSLLLPKAAPLDEAQGLMLVLLSLQVVTNVDETDFGGYGGALDWPKLKEKLKGLSFFEELRALKMCGGETPVDVTKLFNIIDGDACPEVLSVTEDTVSLLMNATLFPSRLKKKKLGKELSYLSWPSFFALIAALNDDRFGRDGFSPNPSRRDVTHLAARYLLGVRSNIEVRFGAARSCSFRRGLLPPLGSAARCSALVP